MNERESYIALNMMEKVGPVRVRKMVGALGSVPAILEAEKDTLTGIEGVGPECAGAIIGQRESVDWEGEQDRAAAIGEIGRAHV